MGQRYARSATFATGGYLSWMRVNEGDIYIKPLAPGDAAAHLDLLTRNAAFFRPFEPRRPPELLTLDVQRDLLETLVVRHAAGSEYGFGVFLAENDMLIGRANLSNIVRRAFQSAYLGYYLDGEHNGRGYMTSAIDVVVDLAFGPCELHRVQAAVMPENTASIRVVEKVGFRREGFAPKYLCIDGIWRDHYIYALTVEDRPERRSF